MKVIAVVQARMGSVRLPGKVLMPIAGFPAIDLLLKRLANARTLDEVIVATSSAQQDDILAEHLKDLGIAYFRGDEHDVLSRFVDIHSQMQPDVIVRLTGDCPFLDPTLVDSVVNQLSAQVSGYSSNIEPPTFPHGFDVEAFTCDVLEWTQTHPESKKAMEHVTTLMRQASSIKRANLNSGGDYAHIRVTLDNPEDLTVIQNVASRVSNVLDFGWNEVVALYDSNPELFRANQGLIVRGQNPKGPSSAEKTIRHRPGWELRTDS
jgi:glutamate-1-semialdehyde 2,1-aminomutase